jgi:hypothetical protein
MDGNACCCMKSLEKAKKKLSPYIDLFNLSFWGKAVFEEI